tara:strand:- start:2204 stop:3514 length:1311 start_codon:yes stop_codon:yes gene_type:complete
MLNIKKIFEKIADAGQKILENKNLKRSKKKNLIDLCDELLSSKGAAFGITLARDILLRYNNISFEDKEKFLKQVNEKYKPDVSEIENSIDNFNKSKDDLSILNLSKTVLGKRKELFIRLNMAPNGTSEIVSLREDLLKILKKNPDLKSLDYDLIDIFKNWFNPGFLKLKKITWDTKAAVLEKILKNEKVHSMKDMNELKRRLGEDRRFFAYFHPALEDEPLIFVEIALTKGLGKSIQELTRPSNEKIKDFDTATFYSISNCQEGLSRVTLGNFLIKRVVYELQEEFANIKYFGTLSPMQGFADWFKNLEDNKISEILGEPNKNILDFLKSPDLKIGDKRIVDNKESICRIALYYLTMVKNELGFPLNDVCRFHLKNGAEIDDIVINGNVSEIGFKRSFGVMVNYNYELKNIEQNHQEYVNDKKVNISRKIKKYVKN